MDDLICKIMDSKLKKLSKKELEFFVERLSKVELEYYKELKVEKFIDITNRDLDKDDLLFILIYMTEKTKKERGVI